MNLNEVQICGHVGRDAELRQTQGGQALAKFSVAINQSYKDGKTGDWVERPPLWIDCTAWGSLSEQACRDCHKGANVWVIGKLAVNEWTGQNEQKHKDYEVVVRRLALLAPPLKDVNYHASGLGPPPEASEPGDLGPPIDMDDNPLSPLK